MSIDVAIRRIDEHNYIHQRKEPRAVYITEAFDTLIEVAKKYQKIEQILDDYDLEAWEVLEKVKEVVEDGNVD